LLLSTRKHQLGDFFNTMLLSTRKHQLGDFFNTNAILRQLTTKALTRCWDNDVTKSAEVPPS
jgi:hypothetical protein